MTCEEARNLIQDKVDGLLSEADSGLLGRHLGQCSRCRAELVELLAIDSVLADSAVIPAPRWLPDAVAAEIRRGAAARTIIERIVIGVGAPAAAAAAVAALRPLTASEAEMVARVWGPLSENLAGTTRTPGFSTWWSQNPSVQGFVLALSVAALALLAIVALKLSRQLTLEWR